MSQEIQYPCALDENNTLVFIKDVVKETRHDHTYHCPNCGHEMRPRLGNHNAHCFAHSENQKCGIESYIHSAAKIILAERFNDLNQPFIISLSSPRPCLRANNCELFQYYCSCRSEVKDYDLKEFYDYPAEMEVDIIEPDGETHFRPDILLRSSNSKRKEIFIEVYHKHKSTISKKKSGHRIIEIRIRSFGDLEKLNSLNCLDEGENVRFYNFVRPVTPEQIAQERVNYARECGFEFPIDSLPPCKNNPKDILKYCNCPQCGEKLVYRKGPYGSFYGCSDYPICKFTFSSVK